VRAGLVSSIPARSGFLVVAGLALSVLSIWVITQLVDIDATLKLLRSIDVVPLFLVGGVLAIQLALRSIRWEYLLPTSEERVAARRLAPVLLVGYLGNILLPARLGEPIRAYLVSRREAVTLSGALGSVLLERVIDLATVAVVAWVAAVAAHAPDWIITGTGVIALAAVAALLVLVIVGVGRVANWFKDHFAPGSPVAKKISDIATRFGEGAGGQQRRWIGLAVAISAVCWLLDGTTFWLIATAVGAPVAWTSCLLIATVTVVGTAIPSAPGYVGTFELATVGIGAALGIASESMLAVAIVAHAMTTLPLAIGGALVLAAASMQPVLARTSRNLQNVDR